MTDGRHKPVRHGTPAGYQRCHPTCEECELAWRVYQRAYSRRTSGRRVKAGCVRGLGWPK